jgi:hypothetical protein
MRWQKWARVAALSLVVWLWLGFFAPVVAFPAHSWASVIVSSLIYEEEIISPDMDLVIKAPRITESVSHGEFVNIIDVSEHIENFPPSPDIWGICCSEQFGVSIDEIVIFYQILVERSLGSLPIVRRSLWQQLSVIENYWSYKDIGNVGWRITKILDFHFKQQRTVLKPCDSLTNGGHFNVSTLNGMDGFNLPFPGFVQQSSSSPEHQGENGYGKCGQCGNSCPVTVSELTSTSSIKSNPSKFPSENGMTIMRVLISVIVFMVVYTILERI